MQESQRLKGKSMIYNWASEINVRPDELAKNRQVFVKTGKSI